MMDSIGNILRGTREDRKIPVAQVARDTKINERYIVAMEEGEFSRLPATAYAMGFLRIYAEYLGLDSRPLIEQYQRDYASVAPSPFVPDDYTALSQPLSLQWKYIIVGIGIVAASVLIIMPVVKVIRTSSKNHTEAAPPKTEELETLPLPVVPQKNPTASPAEATPTPQVKAKKKLSVKARENVWVKVYADGALLFQGVVHKGKEETWQANQSFDCRIGKARITEVALDGKPLREFKGKEAQNIFIDKEGKVIYYKGKMRSE